jgi:hypothetical protein
MKPMPMKTWSVSTTSFVLLTALANAQAPMYPACVPPETFPEHQLGTVAVDLAKTMFPLRDYADELIACGLVRGGPDTGPRPVPEPKPVASSWLETDRRIYRELLARQVVDVLVVPFQTQGYGFDRSERSLMSADLAYSLDGKVADPFLVARALGEGRRRFADREIWQLAHELKAKTVIFGYVGHLDRKNMLLTLQAWKVPRGQGEPQRPRQQDWPAIPFSHDTLPSMVFHRMLPDVAAQLGLSMRRKRAASKSASLPSEMQYTPQQLTTWAVKEWPASSVSLLLAALAPRDSERTRERLFERAWLASMMFDASHARQRFTQAFALMQLGRRPAALQTLQEDKYAAAAVLRELLNGNLPQAKAGMAAVKAPYERLLLDAAVQDLMQEYHRPEAPNLEGSMKMIAVAPDVWGPLIAFRLTDSDPWQVPTAPQIRSLIDEIVPRPSLDAAPPSDDDYDVAIDVAAARHLRKVTQSIDLKTAGPAPNSFDLIWLLEGVAESRLVKELDRVGRWYGLPRRAVTLFDKYRPMFDGHPALALQESKNAAEIAQEADDDERLSWRRKANADAMLVVEYGQGQSTSTHGAVRMDATFDSQRLYEAYGHDFPRRSYWSPQLMSNRGIDKARGEVHELVREGLAFNQMDASSAFGWLELLPNGERETTTARLAHRFKGAPGRERSVARASTPADPIAAYRAAIQEDPGDWRNYRELGRLLIMDRGEYGEAAKVFLGYPGFDITNRSDAVARANYSYDAGSQLYWLGQAELAKPLYEFAAGLDTGSDASMTSAARLDLLAGDYASAAEKSLQRAKRYSSVYAYRDYLSLLHAMGHGEQAWLGFSQVATQFDLPQVWVAALVGQRKEGLSAAGFKKWVMQPQIRNARFRDQQFAPHYTLMWSATDTESPADLGRLIDTLEGSPAVRSSLALFADAYVPLRAGHHAVALEKFGAFIERYPLDGAVANSYPLAYMAAASAARGDPLKLEKHLDRPRRQDFDSWLAKAFFHAHRREVGQAENALRQAFQRRPHTDYRPILTEFQFADACEWIYRITGETRFKDMLLDWSTRHQQIQPTHAWAYAMQYTHESDPVAKARALAMTLYLDPKSRRTAKAKPAEIAEAKQWLQSNKPFAHTRQDQLRVRH